MIKIINNKKVFAVNRVVLACCNYMFLLFKNQAMPDSI